jgi:hypothetical protein
MTDRTSKEQVTTDDQSPAENADETRAGTPNPTDPNKLRSTEHKSGYGGEGGDPRTSSDRKNNAG